MTATNSSAAGLDFDLVKQEFPTEPNCLYLNTGSCGRKPQSVLQALSSGWNDLNVNPTLTTFIDDSALRQAKEAAAKLFDIPEAQLLLVQNTTQGLQFLMQSFLLQAGDELVTTTSEHGSVNVLAEYLAQTRGIVVHKVAIDPLEAGSDFDSKLIKRLNSRTKLVLVSEISSYSGLRPNLMQLESRTKEMNIPLLVDGAHAGGQIICRPGNYRLWVGSGHKWLGGPNGTGFVYVAPDLVQHLRPLWLGDEYFKLKQTSENSLICFESQGSNDVVRWRGLTAAINLHLKLGPENIYQRELELVEYLRKSVNKLNPNFRTPAEAPNTGMLVMHWTKKQSKIDNLRDHLWLNHKIWVQPDFINADPGLGFRISCHYALSECDLDKLVHALNEIIDR